ncbi:MAG: nitrate reductase [Verrucomicrobiales bacterium]|nr:nitrate reductase [Verrucomicrobiales bacterium]
MSFFVANTGSLTSELKLTDGAFGLGRLPERLQPNSVTDLVCGFCSTGCGLTAHLQDGQAVNLTPTAEYPVNIGMACPKGWEALTPLTAPDRATKPLLRNQDGLLEEANWDIAIQTFCNRFKQIQATHGNSSVAFISTGQIVTEEMALLGALAKFGMGMVHGDGNTRQCMATSVAAYKQSFGFDAPPFTYQDFEESDVIVLVGSNLCIAHPIMWQRILRNPHSPRIIVIDPRTTETALAATQHLAILPKSDLTFLYGIANILIQNGWINQPYIDAHTEGFEEFKTHIKEFDWQAVAAATGLRISELIHCAEAIAHGKRVSFWWTMGVNQSHEGTRVAQAIINLALMTGNIGRPGTGANSITGQCNAMGSRLFSNTTNLFGGRDFANVQHRQAIAERLNIPVSVIPDENSLAYDQIVAGIESGQIKGLWFIGTNPSHSWIDQSALNDLLKKLDFLVVQDMFYTTETAQQADLILPAAAWGEKEGTFVNSERRIGVCRKIARAPGEALADFAIFRLIAHYWGCAELLSEWSSPEAVFQILKRLSAGQPCDITGIRDYRMIAENGGIQWPCLDNEDLASNQRRLFTDGKFFHPNQKARFCFEAPRFPEETIDSEYPFTLLTGRGTSAQWHTQTRTSKSAVLRQLYPEEIYVEISHADANRLKVKTGDWIGVRSRRGSLQARVVIAGTVQEMQIFIPMHYRETNLLTKSSFDPYSRQPSYKYCAVALFKP